MGVLAIAAVGLLLACAESHAQVPESGRWQELSFSAEAVDGRMEDRFIDRVVDLAATGQLDRDRVLLGRLQAMLAALVRQAAAIKPEAALWPWEVHLSSDLDLDAVSMAGGKILIGSAFVGALALDEGELAMLLAHEVAHALAEHQRETLSEALQFNRQPVVPLDVLMERLDTDLSLQIKLSGLSSLQESEADQLGMVLAHRAGWPASAMVSFYRKLAEQERASVLSGGHPAAASRLSMAKGMALLLTP